MYIAHQFGTGINQAESVAEAFKPGAADIKTAVAVFEAGEMVFEAASEASKTNFETGTAVFQSAVATHMGKHLKDFVRFM